MQFFAFKLISIQKMDKALCHLEKVTVRFKWSEFNIELEWRACTDFLDLRLNAKWIFNKFTSCLVHNLQKWPVDADREYKFILNCNRFWLTYTASMSERKIYWVHCKL
jgi:hypothetical protein